MANVNTNSLHAFILASRPKTLGAITCPVIIGSAFALKSPTWSTPIFLATLLCALLLQVLANLANDLADFMRGSDTQERLGPPRAMQMGFMTQDFMRSCIAVVIAGIAISGLYLVSQGGLGVLLVGLVALFFALWYSMGPLPLSRLGFSEVVVFFFFGPIPALGAYFLQSGEFSLQVFLASISPGFISMALMMMNNLRDIDEDSRHNKKTLAVRFGEMSSRFAIVSLLILAGVPPFILWFWFNYSAVVLLAALALAVPLRHTAMILCEPISRRFNVTFSSIGLGIYLFCLLMTAGIAFGQI